MNDYFLKLHVNIHLYSFRFRGASFRNASNKGIARGQAGRSERNTSGLNPCLTSSLGKMKYMLEDLVKQGFKPDRLHLDLSAWPLALPCKIQGIHTGFKKTSYKVFVIGFYSLSLFVRTQLHFTQNYRR
ncbi:hypothetical protein Y032_0046g1358 [Ancylostoma ceylanicum]|uniref:Uncharacterized protein n=1 Tax=Ancylostoma ceylanicum TaxID=53326 RepID=A0A016UBI9_9BILA|nr:hypothetical protein Y032_0046g1358 [Ancylostoma ceylanicum]